ncbi:MAG: radical SAM protein [Nocardioidaceae bacterium]
MTDDATTLTVARRQVLGEGRGLNEDQLIDVLRLGDEHTAALLALAHEVRMRWCGPEVEVEGIVSLKTGGCPEDCHFCSQSGQFSSPVRAAWLDIPELVEAARQTAATGATEFCIVAAVRGPDERLLGAGARRASRRSGPRSTSTSPARSGMLTQEQVDQLAAMGVHRYNHNLEAASATSPR